MDGDDFAASIFVLFGDPGFLSSPNKVPTLRYVWSTARHKSGTVVANPYMPELVKNIVVRAGPRDSGQAGSDTLRTPARRTPKARHGPGRPPPGR